MATFNLSLSNKTDINGKSEILIRACFSRSQIYRIKSNLFVEKKYFLKNKISIPRLETAERFDLLELEQKLRSLINFILDKYQDLDKSTISAQDFENIVRTFHKRNPKQQNQTSKQDNQTNKFFEIFQECMSRKKISDVRRKGYNVVFRMLKRFELYKKTTDKKFSLSFSNITTQLLYEIEDFFSNEINFYQNYPEIYNKELFDGLRLPTERSKNYTNNIFKILRAVILWCNRNGYTQNNPFANFKINEDVYGTPYYITIEERNNIYTTDFTKRPALAVQRDIFVFQCLIGCRVSDLYRLTKQNIIDGAIEYIARKTKEENPVTVRVPLVETAKEIIERYQR